MSIKFDIVLWELRSDRSTFKFINKQFGMKQNWIGDLRDKSQSDGQNA